MCKVIVAKTVDKVLLQTHVKKKTMQALNSLARAAGNTRAGYLRHLVEMHVLVRYPKSSCPTRQQLPRGHDHD